MFLTACAEWDDHYDSDTSVLSTQGSSLWKNISSNESLSQFASLLKKTGYDAVLDASQTYTVWAPVNGSFDYEVLSSQRDERLLKEFVENHIARNNYPASGLVNERIYTLNEKLMLFSGSGSYVMQGIAVDHANLACSNGVIHTLKGKIPFSQNIYESLNSEEYSLDSIAAYFHSYDVKKLNERKSVQGPTLNGEITYLDSIFDEHNELFNRFRAYINREDSNYTMILPTNEAWRKAKAEVSSYFNYLPSFEFMENTSTDEPKKVRINIKDVAYLQDSVVNMILAADLFYNNNLYDNKKLETLKTGETLRCDSLCTTLNSKIYSEDAARLFENAIRMDKSNGSVWITDSLRMRSWTTWNPEIVIEAENPITLASAVNVADTPERTYVIPGTQNPEVKGHISSNYFITVQPVSASTNPGVVFYLPDVRSTTYSIYMVMVPGNINNLNLERKLPNRFKVTMGYADEKGVNDDKNSKWVAESTFESDSCEVDTVYLGDFTFPMAYAGTGNYFPYLRVNSAVTSRERANYDRTLRIDCIILRPKELDNYLKEHPDYKYDKGDR
jgi:uncharacterized surface protein with fasciclin (FAS1) repeats